MKVQKQQHQTKMDGLKKNKLHINLALISTRKNKTTYIGAAVHNKPFHLCLRYQVPIISVFQVIKIVANYMFSWASQALTMSIMSSECELKN